MNKIKELLEKYLLHIIMVLFVLITLNNCSQSNTNKKLVKQNQELIQQLDTLKKVIPTQEKFQLMLQIVGYEISENILNDFNDFARSKASPTERSRYYRDNKEQIIQKLKQLN